MPPILRGFAIAVMSVRVSNSVRSPVVMGIHFQSLPRHEAETLVIADMIAPDPRS